MNTKKIEREKERNALRELIYSNILVKKMVGGRITCYNIYFSKATMKSMNKQPGLW